MAKGRRLPPTHRTERLLGSYSYNHHHHHHHDSSELSEDDIWSTADEIDDHAAADTTGGGVSIRGRYRISRDEHHRSHVGGLSLAFDNLANNGATTTTPASRILHQYHRGLDGVSPAATRGHHHMASSAPVNVPDWSKILRVDSVESLHDMDNNGGFDDGCGDESEMVPPHEYLAREYARSRKMAANSVFEGVGRTLKGRDMRRVRDAVWNQTGFDG